MKRFSLLIFGGSGFVGGNLTVAAQAQGWEVTIADTFYRPGLKNVKWLTVDITDAVAVRDAVLAAHVDAVVNVAAVADIDLSEQNREMTWKVNVEGARNVAAACREANAKYVFFSSDAVFDGKGSGYSENDAPSPVNYYGHTKTEAEKAVLAVCPTAAVIRISLVLGLPVTGGNSFVGTLRDKLAAGVVVLCPTDEVRTPVDVHTLCEAVLELAQNGYAGILHIGGMEHIDRYELTRRLALSMGFDETLVKPNPQGGDAPGRAPRHKNGIIDVTRARQVLKTPMLGLDETIMTAIRR